MSMLMHNRQRYSQAKAAEALEGPMTVSSGKSTDDLISL